MKESQKLKQEADKLDNDFAYMAAMRKVKRQERVEVFEDYLKKLKNIKSITFLNSDLIQGKHTFNTDKYGIIDYYPKADRLLIRKTNKWYHHGLNWLKQTFL